MPNADVIKSFSISERDQAVVNKPGETGKLICHVGHRPIRPALLQKDEEDGRLGRVMGEPSVTDSGHVGAHGAPPG